METIEVTPKRGRGRPSTKNPSSTLLPGEDTRTIIMDPVLSPYKIVVTENSFNVVDIERPQGAIADNPYAYCTSLENALIKITKLKSLKGKTYSLSDYINEYKNTLEEIKKVVKLK